VIGALRGIALCVPFALTLANASIDYRPDALLSIDVNRAPVVEKIVSAWSKELSATQQQSFRTKLMGLRADQLLAANLSGSFDGVLEVLNAGETSLAAQNAPTAQAVQPSDQAKALGDVNQDLVYTPIAPCRVFDTRTPNTPFVSNGLSSGVVQTFDMDGTNLSAQGGSATGCNIPAAARAVVLAFSPLAPPTTGWVLGAANDGTPLPASTLFNYSSALTLTTFTVIMPMLGQAGGDIRLEARGVAAYAMHGVGDVTGYFMPPSRNGDGLRVIQSIASSPGTTLNATVNVINGDSGNRIAAGFVGGVIAGGGGSRTSTGQLVTAYNEISADFGTISGGYYNFVGGFGGVVSGGTNNRVQDSGAVISGGLSNVVSGYAGAIGGGRDNIAGTYGFVPGGNKNNAGGAYSFAGGRGASTTNGAVNPVNYFGAFAWADSADASFGTPQPFRTTANNQFAVRARGGVVFKVDTVNIAATASDATAGCSLPSGGAASWSCSSDRNLKDGIKAISPKDVLSKVVNLPLSTWQFKGTSRRHLSPMAQDFWAAFGFGEDDRHITASDVSGVALAAVQGVNQKMNDELASLKAKNAQLQRSNEAMLRELAAIKKKLGF
jgi:hypothetical protein